jgi:hypothetical protein
VRLQLQVQAVTDEQLVRALWRTPDPLKEVVVSEIARRFMTLRKGQSLYERILNAGGEQWNLLANRVCASGNTEPEWSQKLLTAITLSVYKDSPFSGLAYDFNASFGYKSDLTTPLLASSRVTQILEGQAEHSHNWSHLLQDSDGNWSYASMVESLNVESWVFTCISGELIRVCQEHDALMRQSLSLPDRVGVISEKTWSRGCREWASTLIRTADRDEARRAFSETLVLSA